MSNPLNNIKDTFTKIAPKSDKKFGGFGGIKPKSVSKKILDTINNGNLVDALDTINGEKSRIIDTISTGKRPDGILSIRDTAISGLVFTGATIAENLSKPPPSLSMPDNVAMSLQMPENPFSSATQQFASSAKQWVTDYNTDEAKQQRKTDWQDIHNELKEKTETKFNKLKNAIQLSPDYIIQLIENTTGNNTADTLGHIQNIGNKNITQNIIDTLKSETPDTIVQDLFEKYLDDKDYDYHNADEKQQKQITHDFAKTMRLLSQTQTSFQKSYDTIIDELSPHILCDDDSIDSTATAKSSLQELLETSADDLESKIQTLIPDYTDDDQSTINTKENSRKKLEAQIKIFKQKQFNPEWEKTFTPTRVYPKNNAGQQNTTPGSSTSTGTTNCSVMGGLGQVASGIREASQAAWRNIFTPTRAPI